MGHIGTLRRQHEAHQNDVVDDFFQRHTVLFIHRQKEKGNHKRDHDDGREGLSQQVTGQEVGGQANDRSSGETHRLTDSELVQNRFGLDLAQIFGDTDKCDKNSSLMCSKHRF